MVFDPYIELRQMPMRMYITPSVFDQLKQFLTYDTQVSDLAMITYMCHRNLELVRACSFAHSKRSHSTRQTPDLLLFFLSFVRNKIFYLFVQVCAL